MLHVIAIVIGGLAVIAWLSAAVHALLLLPHRREEHSLFALAFQGWRFYSSDTWKESGQAIHRRFVGSTLAFFLLIVAVIITAMLTAYMAR